MTVLSSPGEAKTKKPLRPPSFRRTSFGRKLVGNSPLPHRAPLSQFPIKEQLGHILLNTSQKKRLTVSASAESGEPDPFFPASDLHTRCYARALLDIDATPTSFSSSGRTGLNLVTNRGKPRPLSNSTSIFRYVGIRWWELSAHGAEEPLGLS